LRPLVPTNIDSSKRCLLCPRHLILFLASVTNAPQTKGSGAFSWVSGDRLCSAELGRDGRYRQCGERNALLGRGVFGEHSDNHLIIFSIDIHYDSSHLIYLHIHQLSLLFEPPPQTKVHPNHPRLPLLRFPSTQIYETQSSFATSTHARGRLCGVLRY